MGQDDTISANRVKQDERYMKRCLLLAKKALGHAAPNPMVGCVIVHRETIIGEGYTSAYGGAHAEVNAIHSVRDLSLLPEATLYVTLEPCSHHGKTPPCVDLILSHKIPEVVIGLKDPHVKVAGQGIEKLKKAGCKVRLGVLEDECKKHHRRFLTFHQKKRPYIILKWAQSLDGFMAPEDSKRNEDPQPYWLTNRYSRQLVHKWRSEEQAILVGTNTVIQDNPQLGTRYWNGKSPIRIFPDRELKVNTDHQILDGTIKTIVLTKKAPNTRPTETIVYETLDFEEDVVAQLNSILYKHQLISVIVEGGAQMLQAFIKKGLWDEARIFTSPSELNKGLKAPDIDGEILVEKPLLNDQLKILLND